MSIERICCLVPAPQSPTQSTAGMCELQGTGRTLLVTGLRDRLGLAPPLRPPRQLQAPSQTLKHLGLQMQGIAQSQFGNLFVLMDGFPYRK